MILFSAACLKQEGEKYLYFAIIYFYILFEL